MPLLFKTYFVLGLMSATAHAAVAPAPAPAAFPAPARVVSLNLCTDELALLLAAPGQMASVSFLGADTNETPLADRARGLPTNNGRLDSVIALAPDLVLTGGATNSYANELAARLQLRVIDVPQPQTLDALYANIRAIAAALERRPQGEALVSHVAAALGPVPAHQTSALLLGGGGYTAGAQGLAAAMLRHAGLTQIDVPAGQVSLERLLSNPPQVIVKTAYRTAQSSLGQSWLQHPALRALPASTRTISTDGRAWTCMGPLVADEIARLRMVLPPLRKQPK